MNKTINTKIKTLIKGGCKMKKFKKLGIVLCSAIVALSLGLVGCGSDSDLSLDSLVKNLQSGDISKAKDLLIKSSNNENFNLYDLNSISADIEKFYYKNVTFKVMKMDKQDKTATAKVKFEYPDMNDVDQKAFKEVFNDKEALDVDNASVKLADSIVNNLKDGSFKKLDKEVDLSFEKGTDNWLIKYNDDLDSILCKPLNDTYVLCNGTNYTLDGMRAFKNLDMDWLKKNCADFSAQSLTGDDKKNMTYLSKISKRDNIIFNEYTINDDNALDINMTIKSPNVPKLYQDNFDDMEAKFEKQATESNYQQISLKIITEYLNNKKFDMLENKADVVIAYDATDNKFNFDFNDGISAEDLVNNIFGDLSNMGN